MTDKQTDLCICMTAAGSREHLARLYENYSKPIFLFALSLVKNKTAAEDVMQDVFLQIMLSAKNYQTGTKPKAWIYSIARNICCDCLKKAPKNTLQLDAAEFIGVEENGYRRAENAILAFEALRVLEETERLIVSMYIYSGLKKPEIAEALSMPYSKVRAKYDYAIKKLRRYFAEQDEDIV
ncbi:MAG: sigma-70 family RNA polymerase sigma factor [Eubacterium sp.]|nr:sigma-70 family RNA polymerase sigma factor [Eubacterium sp.]